MRIGVSGTTKVGKTTYISDFLEIWSRYKLPDKSYRGVIKEDVDGKNLQTGETTQDIQEKILNFMTGQHKKYRSCDMVVFDRCPLDNLVYTLWGNEKGFIDDKFVEKTIKACSKSLGRLDLILLIPITKAAPVQFEGTEDEYVFMLEIDHLFKSVYQQWMNNADSTLFDPRDKPAIIEIFGSQRERIELTRMYLNGEGEPIDATPTLEKLSEMGDMNKLIDDQKDLIRNRK